MSSVNNSILCGSEEAMGGQAGEGDGTQGAGRHASSWPAPGKALM